MKNILVALDFEDKFSALVDIAAELAKKFGAKVWLVHVAAPEPDFVGYDVGPQYIRDFRAQDLREEHKSIQKFVKLLEETNIEADGILLQGATSSTILEQAEKLNIDLIIIGHHEHSLFYDTFLGNSSSSVINKSKVPVMVIPVGKT